jgi:putative ABC transport system substrate-binding protein
MRRIGVLMSQSADDPDALAMISAFAQGLQERKWAISSNVRMDYRWGAGDLDRIRRYAAELVALESRKRPDPPRRDGSGAGHNAPCLGAS